MVRTVAHARSQQTSIFLVPINLDSLLSGSSRSIIFLFVPRIQTVKKKKRSSTFQLSSVWYECACIPRTIRPQRTIPLANASTKHFWRKLNRNGRVHSSSTTFIFKKNKQRISKIQTLQLLLRRPGLVTDLTIFSYTHEELVKVMEEMKRLYVSAITSNIARGAFRYWIQRSREYSQCQHGPYFSRSQYRVHPFQSIYHSFYTTSSLKLTAPLLHVNSSNKLPLFQKSLSCYKGAKSRLEYASC